MDRTHPTLAVAGQPTTVASVLAINKVIRNTYLLLSLTLQAVRHTEAIVPSLKPHRPRSRSAWCTLASPVAPTRRERVQ